MLRNLDGFRYLVEKGAFTLCAMLLLEQFTYSASQSEISRKTLSEYAMDACFIPKKVNLAILLSFFLALSTISSARRRPCRSVTGYVAIANRKGGTVSLINPRTLKETAKFKLPHQGEPMYFAFDLWRSLIWVGDRRNNRVVVMKACRNRIRLRRFLRVENGTFHTMPSQTLVRPSDFPLVFTTMDISNATAVHDLRTGFRMSDIPIPRKIRKLGGIPHDVTHNGRYAFITYIRNSDGFGYVASYDSRSSWWGKHRLVKLIRTAKDPHVAVRADSNLVIAAQGGSSTAGNATNFGEVLFASIPDLTIFN